MKRLIVSGNFKEAYTNLKNLNLKELKQVLFELGSDEQNICAYSFICYALRKNESIDLHMLAAALLEIAFCHLEGAYYAAKGHVYNALELKPNDLGALEQVIFLHAMPEKAVTKEEATKAAHKILEMEPQNQIAKNYLENT